MVEVMQLSSGTTDYDLPLLFSTLKYLLFKLDNCLQRIFCAWISQLISTDLCHAL